MQLRAVKGIELESVKLQKFAKLMKEFANAAPNDIRHSRDTQLILDMLGAFGGCNLFALFKLY